MPFKLLEFLHKNSSFFFIHHKKLSTIKRGSLKSNQ